MKWPFQYRVDTSCDVQRPGSVSEAAVVRWSKVGAGKHVHVMRLTQRSNVRAEVDKAKPRSGDREG